MLGTWPPPKLSVAAGPEGPGGFRGSPFASPPAGACGAHSHWIYQALQMALLRRILSRHSSWRPLKFFHLGETSLPLSEGEGWVRGGVGKGDGWRGLAPLSSHARGAHLWWAT